MINIPQRGKYGEIYVKCSWSPITYVMIPAMYARTYDDAEAYVHRHFSYSRARTNHLICHIKALFDMEACTSPNSPKHHWGNEGKTESRQKSWTHLRRKPWQSFRKRLAMLPSGATRKHPSAHDMFTGNCRRKDMKSP